MSKERAGNIVQELKCMAYMQSTKGSVWAPDRFPEHSQQRTLSTETGMNSGHNQRGSHNSKGNIYKLLVKYMQISPDIQMPFINEEEKLITHK